MPQSAYSSKAISNGQISCVHMGFLLTGELASAI